MGSAVYILEKGKVEVWKTGRPEPIATLSTGDYFGEMAMIFKEARTATVKAIESTTVLSLEHDVFQELFDIEEFKGLQEQTRKAARKRQYFLEPQRLKNSRSILERCKARLLAQKLRTLPFFADLDLGFVEELALKLDKEIVLKGHDVIQQGDTDKALYIMVRGEMEVIDECQGLILRQMKSGDIFGELAQLQNGPRTATVRTCSVCELYRLNEGDFQQVLAEHPEVAAKVEQLAAKRI